MDFSKLNVEFSNMQNIISKYNCMQSEIKNRIKVNQKEINKYMTKIKNNKNMIENECYKLIISFLKYDIDFLERLMKEDNNNEKGN